MPPAVFVLFMVAFVAIGLANVLKPRAMMRYRLKTEYGVEGDIEPSETRIMVQRLLSLLVLIVGVWTMLSWGF
ncbi:hypothetical protein [Haladaptatus caseinilyticus]|uniref:hypothetical protein n=1 Tax=Haladaptatus caseinilyticus TaxID=2993314 RepID=UPI00224B3FAF|nr:hypothetical protein [Haladaptatus caseinilyticus]